MAAAVGIALTAARVGRARRGRTEDKHSVSATGADERGRSGGGTLFNAATSTELDSLYGVRTRCTCNEGSVSDVGIGFAAQAGRRC